MATKRELALKLTKNKNRRLASLLQSGVRDGSLFHVLTRNYIGLRDEVQDARYDTFPEFAVSITRKSIS